MSSILACPSGVAGTGAVRIAGITQDSIVDGPGLRCVVFFQGCPLACPGCHNPETRDPDGGVPMSVNEVINQMTANPLTTGVTLSGGEPSAQPGAAAEIAKAARLHGWDVWAYSGYTVETLLQRARRDPALLRFLASLDVLVDGPYVENQRTLALSWRGSANQRLIDMSATLASGCAVEVEGA